MMSSLFSSITTDPMAVLEEKLEEWRSTWKCDDPDQRNKACRAIRAAIAEALNSRDFDGAATQVHSGCRIKGAAKSFKQTTSIGGDNWPLHDMAKVDQVDLDSLRAAPGEVEGQLRPTNAVPAQHHEHDS